MKTFINNYWNIPNWNSPTNEKENHHISMVVCYIRSLTNQYYKRTHWNFLYPNYRKYNF